MEIWSWCWGKEHFFALGPEVNLRRPRVTMRPRQVQAGTGGFCTPGFVLKIREHRNPIRDFWTIGSPARWRENDFACLTQPGLDQITVKHFVVVWVLAFPYIEEFPTDSDRIACAGHACNH